MSRISVYRVADDSLSRERWNFEAVVDREGFALVLCGYAVERRKTARGRFSGAEPKDRWSSMDERHYTSGLSRPTAIPGDVVSEAWGLIPRSLYIGWLTNEHKLAA